MSRLYNKSEFNLVLFDNFDKAGDNAEYFYRWMRENHPEAGLTFLIDKNCSDYKRLEKDGFNVVPCNGSKITQILDNATFILWSKGLKCMPLLSRHRGKSIFLQHGTTSKIYNVGFYLGGTISKYAKYICCSGKQEADILNGYLHGRMEQITCGFPRRDFLLKKNDEFKKNNPDHKQVFISFHWRLGPLDSITSNFRNSRYLYEINQLLNNPELKKIHENNGVKFVFYPHARFVKYLKWFKIPSWIEVPRNRTFQDILVESDVLITDFSSNSFEMAYMNKPSIIYVPDKEYVKRNMKKYNMDALKTYPHMIYCQSREDILVKLNEFTRGSNLKQGEFDFAQKMFMNVDCSNSYRLYDWLKSRLLQGRKTKMVQNQIKRTNFMYG